MWNELRQNGKKSDGKREEEEEQRQVVSGVNGRIGKRSMHDLHINTVGKSYLYQTGEEAGFWCVFRYLISPVASDEREMIENADCSMK